MEAGSGSPPDRSAPSEDAAPAPERRDTAIGVTMVAIAVVVWWPAFTLGVHGELFFYQLLGVWAASTAALVFVLVERRPAGKRLLRAMLLLLPSLWLVLMFVIGDTTDDILELVVNLGAILAVSVGVPFTLWVLVHVTWPDFSEQPRSARWMIILVAAGIAVGSYLLGVNQEHFLTCADFTISGNSAPLDCTPARTIAPG